MRFKESSTDILKDLFCDGFVEQHESFLDDMRFLCLCNSSTEELLEVREGVLVHWVDAGQVLYDEVQNSASDSYTIIDLTVFVDILFNDGGFCQRVLDILRLLLGLLQRADQFLVV